MPRVVLSDDPTEVLPCKLLLRPFGRVEGVGEEAEVQRVTAGGHSSRVTRQDLHPGFLTQAPGALPRWVRGKDSSAVDAGSTPGLEREAHSGILGRLW